MALSLLPLVAFTQDVCDKSGVVFGLFNGVQTTEQQARISLHRFVAPLYGPTTPKGEPITYELFYNDSEGFSDFVETFEQRLQEHNGLLAGRYELFFSSAAGEGRWWDALTSAIPATGELLGRLSNLFTAQLIRDLTADIGRPETFEVAQRHREQIAHWASLDKKMLFLAHSQGNLFVNAAYDHAVGLVGAKAVRVVHVAPASPRATGQHTLANLDFVINGLRLVGSVLPNTDPIPPWLQRPPGLTGKRDPAGHSLLDIYLNPALPTSSRIKAHVLTALSELESPDRKPMPPYPDFVPNAWAGGEQPEAIISGGAVSHAIDKVVRSRSVPFVFVKQSDTQPWWSEDWSATSGAASGWFRTEVFGRGMNGFQHCNSGLYPTPGWAEPLALVDCQWVHFPVDWRSDSNVPKELDAYRMAAAGTRISLSTATYTGGVVLARRRGSTQNWIEFYSGTKGLFSVGIENERRLSERYVVEDPQLQNWSAIRQWDDARRAYLMDEFRRYERYSEQRAEYEQRRELCEAPLPPPVSPVPPASPPAPVPDVNGCYPLDNGQFFCPS